MSNAIYRPLLEQFGGTKIEGLVSGEVQCRRGERETVMGKRRSRRHRKFDQSQTSVGQDVPLEARTDLPSSPEAWSQELSDHDTEELVTDDQIVEMEAE